MANEKHLIILRQGAQQWNQWIKVHPEERPDFNGTDLSGWDLSHSNLSRANFVDAKLFQTNFSDSNLVYADFRDALLDEANLANSNLEEAQFHNASMINAYLGNANLTAANFRFCNLTKANLGWVHGEDAIFLNANLSYSNLEGANLWMADFTDANLQHATLRGVNLNGAKLEWADLTRADLIRATLTGANLKSAILYQARIYGVSVWDLTVDNQTDQRELSIARPGALERGEADIKVDNIEVAQFINLLLNHQKLRNVLNAVTQRGVLILGRFGGGGLSVLQSIATKLRELDYLPIIFDFDRPADRNYTETVKTLAGLSRFVVVDLSGPSVPQELYATVPHYKIPFVPIIEKNRKTYAMFTDILEYPWVLKPLIKFESEKQLDILIPTKIVARAEKYLIKRQKLLGKLFNT